MADSVETYARLFQAAEDATPEQRHLAEKCRDYYDSRQWTRAEEEALKRRKQAPITINRVKPKVDYLLGVERSSRTDPKALPRTPQHEDEADAATAAIRFVEDDQEFDNKRSAVWENLLIEGVGGLEIGVEPRGDSFKVVYKRYNFDRIFYDPHSRARDFSDAQYLGGVVWMDLATAKQRWPNRADELDGAMARSEDDGDTFSDIPRERWVDSQKRRIRVCLIYRQTQDGWEYAWFTYGAFLTEPTDSPYKDFDTGLTACPLIFTSAYIDRDGQRYGYVRQMLDPQDEYNKRRSRALHLLNQRQTYGNQQSGIDPNQVKRALSQADGHVDLKNGKWGEDFGVIPTQDMASGNLKMMDLARAEMDSVGPSESIAGHQDRGNSGRAIMATQQAAQTEIGPLLDGLRHWQHRVYRATWNRIRQFWDGETWIRVTDDKKNLKWVGLNSRDEQGNPQNEIHDLDVDIVIEDAPQTPTLQSETFQMFTDAVRASGQGVPLPVWLEMMPGFPNKEKVLQMLEGSPEEQQAQQQKQQQQEELQMRGAMADIASKEADAQAKQMKAMGDKIDALHEQIKMAIDARQSSVDYAQAVNDNNQTAANIEQTAAQTDYTRAQIEDLMTDILIKNGVLRDPNRDESVNVSA